eukprot:SAG11_NODE_1515_length_4766_cov_3.591172_1_plen_95_part_00
MDALEAYGYLENTVVALWSDHGYHLGDTNSWYVTPTCFRVCQSLCQPLCRDLTELSLHVLVSRCKMTNFVSFSVSLPFAPCESLVVVNRPIGFF